MQSCYCLYLPLADGRIYRHAVDPQVHQMAVDQSRRGGLRSNDVPTEYPFACESCGSVGTPVPIASAGGHVVIGLDPECDRCQSIARDAGKKFPPRFGVSPLTEL